MALSRPADAPAPDAADPDVAVPDAARGATDPACAAPLEVGGCGATDPSWPLSPVAVAAARVVAEAAPEPSGLPSPGAVAALARPVFGPPPGTLDAVVAAEPPCAGAAIRAPVAALSRSAADAGVMLGGSPKEISGGGKGRSPRVSVRAEADGDDAPDLVASAGGGDPVADWG